MGGRKSQKWWANHNLGEGADGLDVDRMRRALNYGADATWAGSGHRTVAQRILAGTPQEPERWGGCVGGHDDDYDDDDEEEEDGGFNAAAVDVDALQAEALRLIVSYGGELRTASWGAEPAYLLKEALQARLGPRVVGLLLQHVDVDFEEEAEGWRRDDDEGAPGGSTPLHWSRRADATRLLVRHGADVDATNDEGMTPLHACIVDDDCDDAVASVLLEAGADVNAFATTAQTPLHAALGERVPAYRRERLVPLLLAWGADPDQVEDLRATSTPLDDALDGLDAAVEDLEQRDRAEPLWAMTRRDVEDLVDDLVTAVRIARLVLQAAAWRRRRHLALAMRMRAAASGAPAAAGATAAGTVASTGTAPSAAAAGSGASAPAPVCGAGVRTELKRAS